jgi:peroxiredoxin family protein
MKTVDGVMEARVLMRGAVEATPTPSAVAAGATTLDLRGISGVAALRKISEAGRAKPLNVLTDAPDFKQKVRAWASSIDAFVTLTALEGSTLQAEIEFADEPEEAPQSSRAPLSLRAVVETAATPSSIRARALASVPAAPLEVTAAPDAGSAAVITENRCTLLVLHNDLEALLAAMMVANACAAQGMKSNVFFSFWAVNLLRGRSARAGVAGEPIGILQRMMRWMMPRGPRAQTLGKMHMGGLGTRMMNYFMRRRKIDSLETMLQNARDQGVTLSVCSMSMGLMGLQRRDIVDWENLDFAGVTSFTELARRSAVTLVF